jgi:hypothetical protein
MFGCPYFIAKRFQPGLRDLKKGHASRRKSSRSAQQRPNEPAFLREDVPRSPLFVNDFAGVNPIPVQNPTVSRCCDQMHSAADQKAAFKTRLTSFVFFSGRSDPARRMLETGNVGRWKRLKKKTAVSLRRFQPDQ